MPLLDVLEDIKVWIAAAIVLALAIGFDSPDASTIMMVALIAQMAVALDGIQFGRDDFSKYKEPILVNIVCCFGLCTGITLLTGLFFMDDPALWTGWVMLSSVPCAISVVPSALFLKADPKLAVLSLTVIYVVAIAVTPLITHVLIGDSVNPLEVLRYILMFILIPFVLTIPLKRLHLKRAPKTVFINIMMFVLVFAGLGSRQEFVFGEPTVVLALVVACILRIFVVSTVMVYAMRRMRCNRDHGLNYVTFTYWKNSGMSASMTRMHSYERRDGRITSEDSHQGRNTSSLPSGDMSISSQRLEKIASSSDPPIICTDTYERRFRTYLRTSS